MLSSISQNFIFIKLILLLITSSKQKKRKEKLKSVTPDCPRPRQVTFTVPEILTEDVVTSQRFEVTVWLKAF